MRSTVFEASMVCSVEKHQVTGLGRGQRDLDRLAIAHLTDQDDLRRLAQRRAQRQRESRRVAVQLALVHRPFLVLCRNSIGSSMVRMCSARVSLIRSMMAASVDDLPDPVGPVTSTMPFFRAATSASADGSFSSASVGIFDGDDAHHDREACRAA